MCYRLSYIFSSSFVALISSNMSNATFLSCAILALKLDFCIAKEGIEMLNVSDNKWFVGNACSIVKNSVSNGKFAV